MWRAGMALLSVIMMALSPQRMWADDYTITVLGGTDFNDHDDEEECECCRHLFDGTTDTKWCSELDNGKVYVIFKVSGKVRMTKYSLTDADDTNDFEGRHWQSWTIYGANFASDNEAVETSATWTAVDSRSDQNIDYSHRTQTFTLSDNTDGYQYYMVKVTGVGITSVSIYDDDGNAVGCNEEKNMQQMAEMTCTFVNACNHTNSDGTSALGTVTHHDATCIQGSYDSQVCSLCNNVVISNEGAVDADAHAFGEVQEAVNATCTVDGNVAYKERTLCHKYFDPEGNELQDYSIPASHAYDDGECTVCGAYQIQIGAGAVNSPYNAYYPQKKYSTSITLYKGSEAGRSGKIARVAYNVSDAGSLSTSEVKVYMMKTDELLDDNDNPAFDWSKFTLVYSGNPTLGTATGWEWLTLDTPFEYDHTHNLLIAVCRQSNECTSNLQYAVDEDNSSYRTIFYYSEYFSSYGKLDNLKTKTITDKRNVYTDIQLEFAGIPTLDTYDFVDGTKYDTQVKANTLTYTRTFGNASYNALYVPFAIPISALSNGEGEQPKASIYRLLNVFEEDKDNDGIIDEWVLKIVKLKEGQSTKPNTPYIIKPAAAGDFSLTLSDVELAFPTENSLWCASTKTKFVFTGTYAQKAIAADSYFFMSTTGGLQYAASDVTLKPQRWYMGIYDKETDALVSPTTFNPQAAPAKAITIVCDDEDTTTGISQMEDGEWIRQTHQNCRIENGKYLKDGRIVIIKNGKMYNVNGQEIQ